MRGFQNLKNFWVIFYMGSIQEFDYVLPEELIAQYPLNHRTSSRLLALNKLNKSIADQNFPEILNLLNPKDLLIFNETKVMNARLLGNKESGGQVELLIERILSPTEALAHMRSSKSPKSGGKIILKSELNSQLDNQLDKQAVLLEILGKSENLVRVKQEAYSNWSELLAELGHVPLPPYIERSDEKLDLDRYQTVFAKTEGSVAAPTAGLHFDLDLIEKIKSKGVSLAYLTLHVGAGTFQPVRTEKIEDHVMHHEWIDVPEELVLKIQEVKQNGGRIIAVGTTSVRALESAALSGELKAFSGETNIFIRPGFKFKVIDGLITNFHLPKSTLLMLVSALAGKDFILQAYQHAIENKYRFFSYGDAMWIG